MCSGLQRASSQRRGAEIAEGQGWRRGKRGARLCHPQHPSALPLASLAGISRSTTVVVAYVMAVTELSCQEVLDAIRTIRPVANPNPGFRQQLAEFGGGSARKVGPALPLAVPCPQAKPAPGSQSESGSRGTRLLPCSLTWQAWACPRSVP